MNAHKVELLILDGENISREDVVYFLENVKYLWPKVLSIKTKEIEDWNDDHPLNKGENLHEGIEELFDSAESPISIEQWIEDQEYYLGRSEDIGDHQHFFYNIEPRTLQKLIKQAITDFAKFSPRQDTQEDESKKHELNERLKELEILTENIVTKQNQIAQKRRECKNPPNGSSWLNPMRRGTIETMEKILKSMQERRECIEARVATLKTDLGIKD
jgi:hypothetical protein